MEDLPQYRITVELLRPLPDAWDADYLQLRVWDTSRLYGPHPIGPRGMQRFSIDVRSRALSLWVARMGAGFLDGPFNPESMGRRAVAGDFGLLEPGLSREC